MPSLPRPSPALRTALAALAIALASPAGAHETLHEIRRDNAIAVKGYHADGELLADAPFELFSPADPKRPWLKGRTDRAGWLAFVPDAPGKWRVRVFDDDGHGLDLEVDGAAAITAPAPAASRAAFVLRPLVGLAVIGAIFAALYLGYRRKGSAT